ncbi:hypothetical protein M0805_009113 [Coniferiporia weirii]|nr:hypothetical protein M0805_009113 [Coniferiporia weirii]
MNVKDQPDSAHGSTAKSSYAPVSVRPDEPPSKTGIETDMYAPHSTLTPFYGRDYGESACRRFWCALAVTLIVWALLGMFVHNTFGLRFVWRDIGKVPDGLVRDWPEFNRGEVGQCAEGGVWSSFYASSSNPAAQQDQTPVQNRGGVPDTLPDLSATDAQIEFYDPPYSENVSFSLPANASLLYFLSRGSFAYGSVLFTVSAEHFRPNYDPSIVEVDIRIGYWTPKALERATVCPLNRGDEHGVGIFTPRKWHAGHAIGMRDMLRFEVTVHLPAEPLVGANSSISGFTARPPRLFNALSTDFSNFKHNFGNLQGIAFSTVDAKTSNAYITAESLEVARGSLISSNGAITGSYETSNGLTVVTSNAGIAIDVKMHSASLEKPTAVTLATSNGIINSKLSLQADSSGGGADSAFSAKAVTSNKCLGLSVIQQPADSLLTVESSSANGPAIVSLHPAFEGSYTLTTSLKNVVLDVAENVTDPSEKNRMRTVSTDRLGFGLAAGRVVWGEDTGQGGWVNVTGANAQVELALKKAEDVLIGCPPALL